MEERAESHTEGKKGGKSERRRVHPNMFLEGRIDLVHEMWRNLCGATYVVDLLWCHTRCAFQLVHAMRANMCRASHVEQSRRCK
eukprot:170175-Pyramimonas_sp.AAC.1